MLLNLFIRLRHKKKQWPKIHLAILFFCPKFYFNPSIASDEAIREHFLSVFSYMQYFKASETSINQKTVTAWDFTDIQMKLQESAKSICIYLNIFWLRFIAICYTFSFSFLFAETCLLLSDLGKSYHCSIVVLPLQVDYYSKNLSPFPQVRFKH